jgi:hypothetical protein
VACLLVSQSSGFAKWEGCLFLFLLLYNLRISILLGLLWSVAMILVQKQAYLLEGISSEHTWSRRRGGGVSGPCY